MIETELRNSEAAWLPRRASLSDIEAVAALHRRAFFHAMPHMPVLHAPRENVAFYSTIVFPSAEVWLCEHAGMTAGFIAFRSGWIDHLYIDPAYQNRGIGSALLALAQASGTVLRLWTFQCNSKARRFYERHGFLVEQQTDGATNEEQQPDVLYCWTADKSH